MIGDMSDLIVEFQHPLVIIKKGEGQLINGMWTTQTEQHINIFGVIINPMNGSDSSIEFYPGLKIERGQLALYTLNKLTGTRISDNKLVDVLIETEDKISWRNKTFIIMNEVYLDQDCNIKGYIAAQVNPDGDKQLEG